MAGSPERPTNQPLTRGARDKIGSFYSSKQALDKEGKRLEFPMVRILHDFGEAKIIIENRASVLLPSSTEISLTRNFDFHRLQWQIINNSDMSLFMAGKAAQNDRVEINRSLGIIEITYRPNTAQGKGNEQFIPSDLRISGVNREQNRIVVATYDLEDNNRLVELNVSVPDFECLEVMKDLSADDISRVIASIPSDIKKPYKTAGLITEGMHGALNRSLVPSATAGDNESPHSHVLVFKFGGDNSILKKAGYFKIEGNNNIVAVGLERKAASAKDLRPWMVTVPGILLKAQ